jgi:23S rRNA maturation-related 3'-5' exoribonuclease YhaM
MIDLRNIQAELSNARQVRLKTEEAGCEIEALVLDMQNHAWHRVALADLVDAAYDPHLFARPN